MVFGKFGLNVALALVMGAGVAFAQAPTPSSAAVVSGPVWGSLTSTQRTALAPLASSWNSLTENQRRKWIALAPGYATLSATEQAKMHGRMAEWAALSPKERAMARLNFEQTRKMAPDDRTAKWEAYQALPQEERAKFASEPVRKPAGAAVVVRPVASSKLAEVPLPRHTQDTKGALVKNPEVLDRKTLLPKANSVSAPAAPSIAPVVAPAATTAAEPAKP
jgi:exonuclease VII large subunit